MATTQRDTIETDVPQRLDRLPWARWHWLVVGALGFVWILDGLEVTIVGSIGPTLQKPGTLGLSSFQVGLIGAFYVAGGVVGALLFGYLTASRSTSAGGSRSHSVRFSVWACCSPDSSCRRAPAG